MLQQPDGTILVEGIVVPGEPAREIWDEALKRRQIPIRKPATVLEHVRVGTADAALGRFELAALSSKEIPGRVNRDRKAALGFKPQSIPGFRGVSITEEVERLSGAYKTSVWHKCHFVLNASLSPHGSERTLQRAPASL
jgi:hypothetical protein